MATKQFLISGTADDPTTAGTAEYSSLLGDGNQLWHATEAYRESIIPTAGKLSNFRVGVKTAPGAGKSWTFTIRKAASGAAMADTALSVTISDTAVLSSLDTDEVTVAAGDRVDIKAVGTGTPTAAAAVYWTCQFTPETDGETILLSNSAGTAIVNTYYHTLVGGRAPVAAEFSGQTLFPTAGTLKKFYVELTDAPGIDKSATFTIRKNGIDQSLVVTISGSATTGNDTDPAHNVAIAAGDKVTIKTAIVGIGWRAKFGIVFLPTTQGEYIASATTDDTTSAFDTEYQHLNCGVSTLTVTETEQHCLAQATTAKAIYVNLSTAPGAGKSYAFILRRNAITNTALTVTISEANTSGNYATDVAISANDLLDTKIVPAGTPATTSSQIAYLLYNTPAVVVPTVSTQAVTDIAPTTATGHGTIEATGGENCDKRGVCWNTIGNPTIADSKSEETDSFGIGAFARPMTGLLPETHYFVKAYAHNSAGYGYGGQVEFDTLTAPPVAAAIGGSIAAKMVAAGAI